MEVLEATIPITELTEDNLIVLDNFPAPVDNGMKVEGRIKYLGFDWSPWVSSQSKVSVHSSFEKQSSLLLLGSGDRHKGSRWNHRAHSDR